MLKAVLNPIAWQFGGLQVHWYGVIIATGVIIALFLAIHEGKRQGIDEEAFYDFLLLALPVAIICARLYYVTFQWSYYRYHPDEIIAIWDGGIAIYGALIGGAIVLIWYCRHHFISPWLFLDVISPGVILAQGMGRWGNFFNQEAFGAITTRAHLAALHLPNWIIEQMKIGGAYRTPTFLYESVWDVTGFILLLALRHRRHLFRRGEVFLAYVGWYAFGRFFIEGMRTDSLMLGPIRFSQWLSALFFIAALGLAYYRRHYRQIPWYQEEK